MENASSLDSRGQAVRRSWKIEAGQEGGSEGCVVLALLRGGRTEVCTREVEATGLADATEDVEAPWLAAMFSG